MSQSNIPADIQRYFKQQAELYGTNFYLDAEVLAWPVITEPAKVPFAEHQNLSTLAETIANCQDCVLSKDRKHVVFGSGNQKASLMVIGGTPNAEDDASGNPFMGQAGELLEKILSAIGFQREEVYLVTIIKCRPHKDRKPTTTEVAACSPILQRQIELIRPRLIMAMGELAAQALSGQAVPIAELRSKILTCQGGASMIITHHPASLVADAKLKHETWQDVQRLRQLYDRIIGDKPPLQLKGSK